MKIKSLRIQDFIREFFIFSVTIAVFIFGNQGAITALLWFFGVISAFAVLASYGNNLKQQFQFTENKIIFETWTLLALCSIIVYFEHPIMATFLLISNLVFICSCKQEN